MALYAFGEFPIAFLDTSIPLGVEDSEVYDENGDYLRQKTVREFVVFYVVSIDGTKCIILFSKKDAASQARNIGIDKDGLMDWKLHTKALGYDWSTMFGPEGYWVKTANSEYKREVQ